MKNKGKEKIEDEDFVPATSTDSFQDVKLELELPPDAKLLKDYEASAILQAFYEEYLDSFDDENFIIPDCFATTLQYAKDGVHYSNLESVKKYLESLLEYGATDGEICMLANTAPETIEEAYALIPSLKEKHEWIEEPLDAVLGVLRSFKS